MTPLRIAMYTEGLPFTGDTPERRALGGSETAFVCVARELAALGHSVVAYCRCEREGLYDGVDYRRAERVEELVQQPADVFLCSRFFHALRVPIRARCRLLWMHDVLMPELADDLRALLPSLDRVFCLSEYHRSLTQAVAPEAAPRLRVTFNGVDHALVERAVAEAGPKRRQVMFTSCPERGLLQALTIYERLDDRTLALLVCGYVPLQPEHVSRIEELRARGFPIRVESFGKRDLYGEIARSLAVVYPSTFAEVFCISAVEAQACGTVFLTIDEFAMRETVGYERVAAGDEGAFLAALRRVLDEPALREELEARGRAHARRYTWRAVAERFLAEADGALADEPARVACFDRIGPRPHLPPPAQARPRSAEARPALTARATAPGSSPLPPSGLPLISCLTVTRGRLRLLKRAIRCYCAQTYPRRELVIVCDGDGRTRRAIERYLETLGRDDVRLVWCAPGRSLGALRNLSMAAAAGDLVCQWDDDDLCHPERLARQSAPLLAHGRGAALLTDQLHFFERERALFWVDWSAGGQVGGIWQLVPGTLMAYRDHALAYPEDGPASRRGEDSAFLEQLAARDAVLPLGGLGHLYVYTYHGGNTFPFEHHRGQLSRVASPDFVRERRPALEAALAWYPLPRPFTLGDAARPPLHEGHA